MKRILIFWLLACILPWANAQKQMLVSTNSVSIGTNFTNNSVISATEHVFPETIYHFYPDTGRNVITVQLRGLDLGKYIKDYGKIVSYDLSSNKVKWFKKFNFNTSSLQQVSNYTIITRPNYSFRYQNETGTKQWQTNRQIYFSDGLTGTALTYSPAGNGSRLEGIDLNTGNIKWFRTVTREYGWNDLVPLNDKTILLGAGGLHIIDLNNGTGWDYNAVTGSKDYTSMIAANVAGVIMGAMTGYYSIYTGYDLVSDICSNVWMDSTGYLFASREKMCRLDGELKPKWTTELPKKKVSKSAIFVEYGLVYMINYGYAFRAGKPVYIGNPFIAAFDMSNGMQVINQELNDKKEKVNDFIVGNNMIICLFDGKIAGYSMTDGSLSFEKKIPTQSTDRLQRFVTDQFYTESDSGFYPLDVAEPGNMHIITDSLFMMTLNDQFDVTGMTNSGNFYVNFQSNENLTLLWKDNKVVVVDRNHLKIAELDASLKSIMIGNKFYDSKGRKLIITDLSDLLRQKD